MTQEAVAQVADVPLAAVRRAAMLAGSTVAAAGAAFAGEEALAAIGLEVGRPIMPMLASSAPDVAAAMAGLSADGTTEVAIDAKLDGIRIQVHRDGDDVLVVTRSLDDITGRLPEVVEVARSLPAERFVLDGEALALSDDGRPMAFQDTASRTAQDTGVAVTPHFFDLLHLDGRDLLDSPGHERLAALDALVPEQHRVRRLVTADAGAADAFATETVAARPRGRGPQGPGRALRRRSPRLRLGEGQAGPHPRPRRAGRRVGLRPTRGLALQHPPRRARRVLAAGFVMLGKTFKGMTDEMLAWQTERFTELATSPATAAPTSSTCGPSRSSRSPSTACSAPPAIPAASRSASPGCVRYRDDKTAAEADTIEHGPRPRRTAVPYSKGSGRTHRRVAAAPRPGVGEVASREAARAAAIATGPSTARARTTSSTRAAAAVSLDWPP